MPAAGQGQRLHHGRGDCLARSPDKEKSPAERADQLLNRAKELKSRADAAASSGKHGSETLETLKSIGEELRFFRRMMFNLRESYFALYERILRPLWKFIRPSFGWIIQIYSRLWNRFAFRTDQTTGERVISRRRAGAVIIVTVLFVAGFTPTYPGEVVRFFTVEPLSDGVLMALTKRTERFFLNSSEEVDPDGNIHSVRGCRIEGECGERDAVYFRIHPRLSHDVWKLVTYGNPIYVPDHVVAPIAPGVNRCEVTYYGYRLTSSWISRLLRSLEMYPTLLETSCTSLSASGRELHAAREAGNSEAVERTSEEE